ncbi:hypothetical protein BVRB_5g108210 [Beta vulgaris subsp. vulgaris]|nr:hypothetical protein BVRB_5g108210 [Beta vulgaris subsp. vulgaris]
MTMEIVRMTAQSVHKVESKWRGHFSHSTNLRTVKQVYKQVCDKILQFSHT